MPWFAQSRHIEDISFSAFECHFCQKKNWIDGSPSTNEAEADIEAMECWNCGLASYIVESDLIESDSPKESAGLRPGRKNMR